MAHNKEDGNITLGFEIFITFPLVKWAEIHSSGSATLSVLIWDSHAHTQPSMHALTLSKF